MSTEPLSLSLRQIDGQDVNDDQRAWLDGFFFGLRDQAVSFADVEPQAGPVPKAGKERKLTAEEKIKQAQHPFDALPTLRAKAKGNVPPEKEDIFRFKWNGLFWLAPVHEGYMCRLRIPGGEVTSAQVRELASIADDIASGYLQITTRNNFQIRIIQPKDTPELLRRIQECGLHSRGSGADNLRNFTATPTAGFDPYELIDVMPYVRDLSYYIINQNEFYDLPRKFNVSYDGGGVVRVAEDTNDIGLRAIRLNAPLEGHPLHGTVEPGIYFQLLLGGVTGHQEFAQNCGAICRPEDATDVVAALTRVFIADGNRGNRGKARMVYLIKEWGFEKYLAAAEELLGWKLPRLNPSDEADAALIAPHDKPEIPHPHLGAYPQKQDGLSYLGVYVPVGLLQTDEARAITSVADEFGSGDLRLTIFQNLIIPNIPTDRIDAAKQALAEAGLRCEASRIRGGAAACTGNRYCKYASSDTKHHAMEVVDYLEQYLELDEPLNIHVTGCPHSCAQHYIGDIGLLACKVAVEGQADPVEGYHVFVGGGFGADRKRLGRQLFKSIPAGDELNRRIRGLLEGYLARRESGEDFLGFTGRHEVEALEAMALEAMAAANDGVKA